VSPPDSKSTRPVGVLIRQPKTTIYVALLGVAVGALVIGCLLLLVELHQYDYLWNQPWKATGL
jgi:hypothetical protein